jgi:hypothetical protein
MVDDFGHMWYCTIDLIEGPDPYFRVGGEWKRFCQIHKLYEGRSIRLGAPTAGAKQLFSLLLMTF